jgi:hypothetical protein
MRKTRYLILSIVSLAIVALAITDACLWHRNTDKNVACTVVFKSDPTVSRTGYPHYYLEVRRNDNNKWYQPLVSGEIHAKLGKGDQINLDINNALFELLHLLAIFIGLIFGAGFFVSWYVKEK